MGKNKIKKIKYKEQKTVAWTCPNCNQWNMRSKPFDMNELTCEVCGEGSDKWEKEHGGFEVY